MTTRKVAVITDASGGVGAGLVAGCRRRDWAVVASCWRILPVVSIAWLETYGRNSVSPTLST